jgi:hypothetical protein
MSNSSIKQIKNSATKEKMPLTALIQNQINAIEKQPHEEAAL